MQYEYTEYSPHGLEMLEKQELCKDYMQGLEPCWKLCDAPFLAMRERESRHFNDESTSKLIPYTAMASLIFPSILYVDENVWIGIVAGVVAVIASLKKLPIIGVVLSSVIVCVIFYAFVLSWNVKYLQSYCKYLQMMI